MFKSKGYWYALILLATVITSCQRSLDVNNKTADAQLAASNDAAHSKCRLVYADRSGGTFTERYQYNSKGLLSSIKHDYLGSIYVYATMQYDSKGRASTATVSFDDITYYPMAFEYENNRIAREITYEPGTTNVIDLLTNTYNNKGQLILGGRMRFMIFMQHSNTIMKAII